MTARLEAVRVHPLKSGRALGTASAVLDAWGLRGDRRWMVVDADGRPVTARKDPRLLQVSAEPVGDLDGPVLRLGAPGMPGLVVTADPGGPHVPSTVFGASVRGLPAGREADRWCEELLGRAGVRLVWCDDPRLRRVDQRYADPGDTVTYQDGFPLLLTTTASLALAQEWVDEAARSRGEEPVVLTSDRFRPNLVVAGLPEALVEQSWDLVRVGDVTLRMPKHCGRCVMVSHDPVTLARSTEPLRSLAAHNTVDGRIVFGVNLVPVGLTGPVTLRVGDPVVPL